jgi:predicted O-methyltransferase YrrM
MCSSSLPRHARPGSIRPLSRLLSHPVATFSTAKDHFLESMDRRFRRPPPSRVYLANTEAAFAAVTGQTEVTLGEASPSSVIRDLVSAILGRLDYGSVPRALWLGWPSEGWISVLRLVNGLTRFYRPYVVVETGVGIFGSSSAAILAALEANESGHLFSIDLDRARMFFGVPTGLGIPVALRPRHTVLIGPSKKVLPKLLAKVAPIDLFLHDGLHTKGAMLWEYRTAFERLRPGGILASDDVWNSAFDDYTSSRSSPAVFVRYDESAFGISVKGPYSFKAA